MHFFMSEATRVSRGGRLATAQSWNNSVPKKGMIEQKGRAGFPKTHFALLHREVKVMRLCS